MTSRIFSINLDDLTFAKLGELQKKYPEMSRNAMIRHIIHVVHLGEDLLRVEANEKFRINANKVMNALDPTGEKRAKIIDDDIRRNYSDR
tara:strand:- start:1256 stop:1525 length:270 start_codon:yes stop_codon:yes gene_type:complete